jgi:hypothetical protein
LAEDIPQRLGFLERLWWVDPPWALLFHAHVTRANTSHFYGMHTLVENNFTQITQSNKITITNLYERVSTGWQRIFHKASCAKKRAKMERLWWVDPPWALFFCAQVTRVKT